MMKTLSWKTDQIKFGDSKIEVSRPGDAYKHILIFLTSYLAEQQKQSWLSDSFEPLLLWSHSPMVPDARLMRGI